MFIDLAVRNLSYSLLLNIPSSCHHYIIFYNGIENGIIIDSHSLASLVLTRGQMVKWFEQH